MARISRALANAWIVTILFSAMTIAMTWPLASVMTTSIAADLGDPIFACWVMMWTGGQVLRFLSGDSHALGDYWNGNIFHGERLTIAYAEHLTPQMLQILPIFAFTHNIVLCYNLLFLSAIVLSAVGMYLFVRELTGQPVAACVAAAAFAFSPYRADQYAHIQIISTQWMPLALYGFQRYFATGRVRALAGSAAAVTVQALSCGYYLFFFTPFAAAFCLFEGARLGALRRRRTWIHLGAVSAVSLLVIWMFATPYLAVRKLDPTIGVRPPEEILEFSADTWSFATASENLGAWGSLQTFPHPEGSGFPGLTILFAGVVGIVSIVWSALERSRAETPAPRSAGRTVITGALIASGAMLAAAWVWLLVWRGGVIRHALLRVTVRSTADLSWRTLAVVAAAVLLVPRFRRFAARFLTSTEGLLVIAWIAAIALAFGPVIFVGGRPIGPGPYAWFVSHVPGFDGLRVPSRYFMIASLFLSALVGTGVAVICRRNLKSGDVVAALLLVGISLEGRVAPFVMSKPNWVAGYALVSPDLPTPANWGAVYDTVMTLPADTVLAEFPFGSEPFDVRAMYFAGFHRKPLLNGFSGYFPESFRRMQAFLMGDPAGKPSAWTTLHDAGVTHVIVHEQPFLDGKGPLVSAWIRNSGGREIAAAGTDRLFVIR